MLGQLAVEGDGLCCKERQVHCAAISVGTEGKAEKREAGLDGLGQASSSTPPPAAAVPRSPQFAQAAQAALSEVVLVWVCNLISLRPEWL